MSEEPFFLFEDNQHIEKLQEIADRFSIKEDKIMIEAVFLRHIIGAAMHPKEEIKKEEPKETKNITHPTDINSIFGEKINPITNPSEGKNLHIREKRIKRPQDQKVPVNLPTLMAPSAPLIEEFEPIGIPTPPSIEDKKDNKEPVVPQA